MKQQGLAPVTIVILIALAFGGYFVYQNQVKSTPLPKQATQITSTPADASPVPTGDTETANWKTYTNQKYGYSVKYPINLLVNESETSYDQYVEFTLGRDATGNAYLANYTVTVAKDSFLAKDAASVNFLSADWTSAFYNMNAGDTKTAAAVTFKKLPDETVAGQNAVVIQVVATGSNQKRYLLKNNGHVYMISDFSNSADSQNFLSSFKFLDKNQTDEAAKWKTYGDVTFKYSFKYPYNWKINSIPDNTLGRYINFFEEGKEMIPTTNQDTNGNEVFRIMTYESTNSENLFQNLKNQVPAPKEILVDGKPALRSEGQVDIEMNSRGTRVLTLEIRKESRLYIDQILATFKVH